MRLARHSAVAQIVEHAGEQTLSVQQVCVASRNQGVKNRQWPCCRCVEPVVETSEVLSEASERNHASLSAVERSELTTRAGEWNQMKFLKSSLLSAYFMAVRLDFRECLWRYFWFLRTILNSVVGRDNPAPGTVISRNLSCRGCSMFYAKLGTCGKPGDTYKNLHTRRIESFGCWCFTEFSNRFASKDCWARARGLEIGWSDELRPPEEH